MRDISVNPTKVLQILHERSRTDKELRLQIEVAIRQAALDETTSSPNGEITEELDVDFSAVE